jgi:steroid delta-isomerase-like uncharacterized protein
MNIIQTYYDAFNRKDWAGMLNCLTDDVRHDINQGETQVGKAKFEEFMQKMDHAYEESLHDMVIMYNADQTRAAAEFIVKGTYKFSEAGLPPAHGQTYALPVGAFFEIQDGRIARVTNYYNLQTWIKLVS